METNSRLLLFYEPLFCSQKMMIGSKILPKSQKTLPNQQNSIFFKNSCTNQMHDKELELYLYRKQGEKIGCETGSSKFQLLEKDY